MFMATCQSQTALHPLLLSAHMFSTVVPLKPPNKDARRDVRIWPGCTYQDIKANFALQIIGAIVGSNLNSSSLQEDSEQPLNYVSLATQTEGYLATDLQDLVSRAVHQATIRSAKEHSEVRARNFFCHQN